MIGGRPYTDPTTLIKGGYVLTLDPVSSATCRTPTC